MNLKPWREIAVPHEDVLKGTFQQAEFAADISKVHQGIATDEYQDASLARFLDTTRTALEPWLTGCNISTAQTIAFGSTLVPTCAAKWRIASVASICARTFIPLSG